MVAEPTGLEREFEHRRGMLEHCSPNNLEKQHQLESPLYTDLFSIREGFLRNGGRRGQYRLPMRSRVALVCLTLAACPQPPPTISGDATPDDTTGEGETSGAEEASASGETTSALPVTSSSTSVETSADDATSEIGTSSSSTDDDSTTGESRCESTSPCTGCDGCSTFLQDCPDGEKCLPWGPDGSAWNSTRCSAVPAEPGQFGDPCTALNNSATSGEDTCDVGLMCWGIDEATQVGECYELCNCGPDEGECFNSGATACVVTNGGSLAVCLPSCNPLGSDCAADEVCVPVVNDDPDLLELPRSEFHEFFCAPDASGRSGNPGEVCEFLNACQPGLLCLTAEQTVACGATGCCTAACALDGDGSECQVAGLTGTACLPWFELGTVDAPWDNLGACLGNAPSGDG